MEVKAYTTANKTQVKERRARHWESNKEVLLPLAKSYRDSNIERARERDAQYYKKHAETYRARKRDYRAKFPEIEAATKSKHYYANKEKCVQRSTKFIRARRKRDPLFKFKCQIRVTIHIALKRGGWSKESRTQALLGGTYQTVLEHLIKTAINNYGVYNPEEPYHIDHIVPMKTATTREMAERLQHFTNLQYLYAKDNLQKSAHLDWSLPRQTSI